MSVIRVGSNSKYADGWSKIFGSTKGAAAKSATKAATKGVKKAAKTGTKKKAAAKKKR